MRRPSGFVPALIAAVLGLALLAGPALADDALADHALDGVAEDVLVLAVDDGSEPLGPDPQPRDAEGNAARELGGYEDQDTPFTWGAAWLLAGAGALALLLALAFYEVRVRRPAQRASAGR